MAEQGCASADAASSIVSKIKAANARLDADSTSKLRMFDLRTASILQPIFELSDSLESRTSIELDEAMVYLREARLCELLLSLLRRWPWAELQQDRAAIHKDLALLPKLLRSLSAFLRVAALVRSSEQAEAYAETCKRCM